LSLLSHNKQLVGR